MKILTIVGARPQFVKAAMLSQVFIERGVKEVIVHTGQHFDANMSDIFFEEMQIPRPDYNLHINSMGHGAMTGHMMIKLEEVMIAEKPNLVLVYGDTNSTLAAALTARKLNIKIAHVEGGLRNFDFTIPEDVNRVLTDRISDYIFCPTEIGMENLKNEGFDKFPCKVIKTGDLLADTTRVFGEKLGENYQHNTGLKEIPAKFILTTVHRQDSTTPERLPQVVKALNEIAAKIPVVFPIHPRTKKVMESMGLTFGSDVLLIDPVGYLDMVFLLKKCSHVITDSGGLQKEAYLSAKTSLLLMPFTPWEELVSNNFTVVSEVNYEAMMANFDKMLSLDPDFTIRLYGDGTARYQIADYLIKEISSIAAQAAV